MTEDERLAQLRGELDALAELPLSSHPETLERVHRALVDELDALADVDAADAAGAATHGDEPPTARGPDDATGATRQGADPHGGAPS